MQIWIHKFIYFKWSLPFFTYVHIYHVHAAAPSLIICHFEKLCYVTSHPSSLHISSSTMLSLNTHLSYLSSVMVLSTKIIIFIILIFHVIFNVCSSFNERGSFGLTYQYFLFYWLPFTCYQFMVILPFYWHSRFQTLHQISTNWVPQVILEHHHSHYHHQLPAGFTIHKQLPLI